MRPTTTREPMGLPPITVDPEYSSDDVSSVSMGVSKQPLHLQPQHRDTNKTANRQSRPQTSRRPKPNRQVKRSDQLQTAMDRIQGRRATNVSSPFQQDESDEDQEEELGLVLEMFSTYDAVLDHLVRKNKNLKSLVRHGSKHYSSNSSYTSQEIRDTLDALKLEQEKAILAPSRPRPPRVGDEATIKETYPQPGGGTQNTRQKQQHNKEHSLGLEQRQVESTTRRKQQHDTQRFREQEQRDIDSPITLESSLGDYNRATLTRSRRDRSPERHVNFASGGVDNGRWLRQQLGCQREILQSRRLPGRSYETSEHLQQTQNLLEIMRDYKADGVISPQRQVSAYGKQPTHGGKVASYGGETSRDVQGYGYSGARMEAFNDPLMDEQELHQQARWCSPDAIERLRLQEDPEYLGSAVGIGGSITTSAALSKLLPEKIPPKIKRSRERIAQCRLDRLQHLENLKHRLRTDRDRARLQAMENLRSRLRTEREMQRNGRFAQNNRYQHERYNEHREPRPGSPERPLNVNDYDNRGRRIGSPESVIRVDEVRRPSTRFSEGRRPVSSGRADKYESRYEHENRESSSWARSQSFLGQPSNRSYSAPRSTRFNDSDSESSSASAIVRARELKAQVDSVYLFSKELKVSHERMNDELQKIKKIYKGRHDSLNNFAQIAESASREASPMRQRPNQQANSPRSTQDGNVDMDLFPASQLTSESSGERLPYRPHRFFLPPQQRDGLLGRPVEGSAISDQGLSHSGFETDYINGVEFVNALKSQKDKKATLPSLQQVVAEFNVHNERQNLNPRLPPQQTEQKARPNKSPKKERTNSPGKRKSKGKNREASAQQRNAEDVDLRKSIRLIRPPHYSPYKYGTRNGLSCGVDVGLAGSEDEYKAAPGDLDDKYAMLSAAGSASEHQERVLLRTVSKSLVNSSSDDDSSKKDKKNGRTYHNFLNDSEADVSHQVAKAKEALYKDPIALPDETHEGGCCRSPCSNGQKRERPVVSPEPEPGCMPAHPCARRQQTTSSF